MEIVDNSHIHLELSVFEKDILKVKKRQKINFKITEASNDTFKAEVHLVGTTIDKNRTIKVHGHPLDESVRFLTGMFVNAEIITSEKQSKVLPENGIVEIDNDYYVLVLDEKSSSEYVFNQVKVNIGNTANGYTEIKENKGITDTDKILVDGAFSLLGVE
jgi:cobalt-zinc-cadmium efflux system membrane fusion protein